jgi:hypothetical protein
VGATTLATWTNVYSMWYVGSWDAIIGVENANNEFDDCVYNGIVASDTHPNGYPCTISGSINGDWSLTVNGGFSGSENRSISAKVYVDGNLKCEFEWSGNMLYTWVTGQYMGQHTQVNSQNGTGTVSYTVPATVGSHVEIVYKLTDSSGGEIGAGATIQSKVDFSADADVGP